MMKYIRLYLHEMKRFLIFAIFVLAGVAGVLFIALKWREVTEVPTSFISFTDFEKKGGSTHAYVVCARHSLGNGEERRTVTLPENATTKDFYDVVAQSALNTECVELDVVHTGSEGSIYFVNYAVGSNLVVETAMDYLSEPAYTEKDSSGLEIYRLRCYHDHYVANGKIGSYDDILKELKKLHRRHVPFCALVSFEEVVSLKKIWNLLCAVYGYSDSRVYLLLPHRDREENSVRSM